MPKILKRIGIVFAMLATLIFSSTMVTPGVAHADNEYTISISPGNAQVGETIVITPETSGHCPGSFYSDVVLVVIDIEGLVQREKIARTDLNGYWSPGAVTLNRFTHPGTAWVHPECVNEFGTTFPFQGALFQVTEQPTSIAIDQAQFGMTSTLSSVPGQGCSPNEGVSAEIYGSELNIAGTGLKSVATLGGVADASGDWTLQVAVDNIKFVPNKPYFARVQCAQNTRTYTSFKLTPRWNEYVALGDSYSSGEGSFNYDLPGGICHRSTDSYPHYLANNQNLDAPDLQACSGAVTDDLYRTYWPQFQMDPLNGFTQKVTLTIGGNDIGFAEIAQECANYTGHNGYGCSTSPTFSAARDRIAALKGIDTTPGDGKMIRTPGGNRPIHPIATILRNIATASPDAKIYIAGYPKPFGEDSAYYDEQDGNAPDGYLCRVDEGNGPIVKYSLGDARTMNILGDELNTAIYDAVREVNDPDIEYVSPDTFTGHGLCDSGVSYINGIGLDSTFHVLSESLHPTVTGMQQGYGAAFADEMNN